MSVQIKETNTTGDLQAFVNFPFTLYKGNQFWVPPIKKDELKALRPETNPAFDFCKTKFWLAYQNRKIVGRIGGIINRLESEKTGEKFARFTRYETIDDVEVSAALLQAAEAWAKENGMSAIHGPLGFSNLDHQGVLVEGFDHLPSIASEYHHPYYQRHLEKNGYEKEMDWVEFRLTLAEVPEKALRLNEAIKQRYGLTVKRFSSTAELKPYGEKIFGLLNEAFAELFSMVPLNERMKRYYIDRYLSFINPTFVLVVEDKDKNPAGFIITLPSLSEAMQKANGSLFPFGWWYIKNALQHPKLVDILLTAVHPKLQSQGVPAILITEMQQIMLKAGAKHAETTGIIETNQKAIQVWKNYEHIQHKRKRCYKKAL
ncbi:hypothetical protein BH11BAC1_BH11BAC1_12870 [soil metagenome]